MTTTKQPDPTLAPFTLRLFPIALRQQCKVRAAEQGISLQEYVTRSLAEAVRFDKANGGTK